MARAKARERKGQDMLRCTLGKDENSGTVSGHSYDTLNENDVLNKRVLAVELLSGESFDVEASEDSQKDILANSYGKAVNE